MQREKVSRESCRPWSSIKPHPHSLPATLKRLLQFLCLFPMLAASWRIGSACSARCLLSSALHRKSRQLWTHAAISAGVDDASSPAPAASYNPHNDDNDDDEQFMEQLLYEMKFLNNNQTINLNSPKQVSTAIFGQVQSTSRQVLELAAQGKISALSPQQQRIAGLVQQYRDLTSKKRSSGIKNKHTSASSVQSNSFSTLVEAIEQPVTESDTAAAELVLEIETPQHINHHELSPYEQQVNNLFDRPKSQLDPYWREPLLQLTRPTARNLVAQLDPLQCPMGFDPLATPRNSLLVNDLSEDIPTAKTTAGKKGSFLAYCREQKEKYPDVVILTRCGDFYETYGLDAILLVEHCGLNAMAGKTKAGCPIRNVQATLDCLTTQGFRVAVYEEAADTDASRGAAASGGPKSRIKSRFLAQIVSDASPTYLYDLVLLGNADLLGSTPPSRPYVGVIRLEAGYTLVEISVEERSVRVSERLTSESVACRLAAYPPADPLIYVPSMAEYRSTKPSTLPFLPSKMDHADCGLGSRLRTHILPPTLVEELNGVTGSLERAKNIVLSALLRMTQADDMATLDHQATSVDDFTLVNPAMHPQKSDLTFTHSLHKETASQLGLMGNTAIPSLVSRLVPESAPAATRRFFRRYLLTPPPPVVAAAMRDLVSYFKNGEPAMPPLSVPPIGKVLSLIRAGQASAEIYRELIQTLQSTVQLLEILSERDEPLVVESLMTLLEYESGMAASPESVQDRCKEATNAIASIVLSDSSAHLSVSNDKPVTISRDDAVPAAFFERNELPWLGRVRYETMAAAYDTVRAAAIELANAIRQDFDPKSSSVLQDIFNNILLLREIPTAASDKGIYVHPRDRFGKAIRNRYTTEKVQDALDTYTNACEKAKMNVTAVLASLSQRLNDDGHIPAIVQASHANLLVSAAFHHAARANTLGWNVATTYEYDSSDKAARLVGLWPYWMDRAEAISNTFDLDGMWILTAPNMAGKSTILRSTAAASLLASCGLCAPLDCNSAVRRFDHIFVRGASSDVPTENKSAFGAEMEDIASLLRSCGERSLVFVDELARGTSPRDGTVLAAAVLEEMARQGMSGVFATHLHEILELPLLSAERIKKKRMEMRTEQYDDRTRYSWTFHLADGVCTDSLALETAERFGVPDTVLSRAEVFRSYVSNAVDELPDKTLSRPHIFPRYGVVRDMKKNEYEDVVELVEATARRNSTRIHANWIPPASLEGTTCVYVLSLQEESGARQYYVGETDNLRQRIEQHRAKGERWTSADTIAVPVEQGRTEARALESLLIRTLARAGVSLISVADGRTVRQSHRMS